MKDLAWRYEPFPDVLCTHLDDGESVLLHLITRQYYTLNETGSHMWRCLEAGKTLAEIIDEFSLEYEIDEDRSQEVVFAYVDELETQGLITTRA